MYDFQRLRRQPRDGVCDLVTRNVGPPCTDLVDIMGNLFGTSLERVEGHFGDSNYTVCFELILSYIELHLGLHLSILGQATSVRPLATPTLTACKYYVCICSGLSAVQASTLPEPKPKPPTVPVNTQWHPEMFAIKYLPRNMRRRINWPRRTPTSTCYVIISSPESLFCSFS
ncbi:hypothetical protein BD779DRAFT_173565 [Infundibulicybe gibba]|nr:hypothetical protein BD779DRAFT_173565 [Infundibulicybe gibba]